MGPEVGPDICSSRSNRAVCETERSRDQFVRRSVLAIGRTCPPGPASNRRNRNVRRMVGARLGRIVRRECKAVLARPNVLASQNEKLGTNGIAKSHTRL